MLKEMLASLLTLFACEQPQPLSLKHLTTIIGYHPAKKLEQTGVDLNPDAYQCAQLVDKVLPHDLQKTIHNLLPISMKYAQKQAFARSYRLFKNFPEVETHWLTEIMILHFITARSCSSCAHQLLIPHHL